MTGTGKTRKRVSYLTTSSGRTSRIVVLALLSVLSQATPLVLWLKDIVSAETWAIVAGSAGMASAVATIVLRSLTSEPMAPVKDRPPA